MKHALFVAFHYPPEASSSGVLRTLKYSRYLADYGWRVTVLTLHPDAYQIVDDNLLKQIPDTVRVVRTSYLNTKRNLSLWGRYPAILAVPDTWIGWLPWAVAAGRRVMQEDPVDLIFSTSPHATAHMIARSLSKSSGAPWVTDFRDPWYEEPPEPGTPAIVHWFARRLERKVIAKASHVVTSTTQLRDMLQQRYAGQPPNKFTAILNGYDEADFSALPVNQTQRNERMMIVHAGNINAEFRDPRPMFRAVRKAADRGEIDPSKLCFRFIGGGEFGESAEMSQCVAECGLAQSVEFLPRVPYEASLAELANADALLLLQASDDTAGLVPAKLYEYLRAQRPVLALVFPGATTDVLATTGGGWAVDPRNANEMEQSLSGAFRAWESNTLAQHCANLDTLRQYDRRSLTGKLAQIFDDLQARE